MDEFVNPVPADRFRATNEPWNDLRLNAPWSVGYVTSLIESRTFTAKEEWTHFYYESGAERLSLLAELTEEDRTALTDFRLAATHSSRIERLPWALKNLNFNFGRTRDELAEKSRVLHQRMQQLTIELSLKEAIACVRFRVVGETWNGVVLRERNAVMMLQSCLPGLRFEKTAGHFDHHYGVDYQLFLGESLLAGIQIKPRSYAESKAPYLLKARQANANKNEVYRRDFGCPVFDVVAQASGEIVNAVVIDQLRALASG